MAAEGAAAALVQLGDLSSLQEADSDSSVFKSDLFRMQCMKVLPCSRRYVHDWTECPFAHPQEKARRRDPSVHNYTGIACPSMKKEGCCAFGDHCPYAHNVFEYWLHPTRYRTQLCNDGSNCKRKICFFAHSLDELRVPACKPFVSPEALASAAASAAADAEAKRRAATVGSPLSAFATLSPGPSPQRASLGSLPAARLSGASVAAPASPSTTDDALMGSSPADAGVQAALQQLSGAGFSSQEQQVIELVTSLLAQDKVSPEQAANILQQMLPPDTLSQLQAHLNTPRASMDEMRVCYSDPLAGRATTAGSAGAELQMRASGSFEMSAASPRAAFLAQQAQQVQQAQQAQQARSAPQGLSLEHLAAMQAAQNMGFAGMSLHQGQPPAHHSFAEYQANPRMSLESARSSFDTGAQGAALRSSSGSDCSAGAQRLSDGGMQALGQAAGQQQPAGSAQQRRRSPPLPPAAQQAVQQAQQAQQAAVRPSIEAAMRRMSAEQELGSASQQLAALQAAAAAHQQHQQHLHATALETSAQAQAQQRHRAQLQAALQQRRQLLQLQQHLAPPAGARPSEDSSRMSFETTGRPSMDSAGRGSVDAVYPPQLMPSLSGQFESSGLERATPDSLFRSQSMGGRPRGGFYGAQLSTVPEQFPMINAPPPSNSWNMGAAGRFSLDSAADRLSEDMSRLSFEAAARPVAAPTANPYASAFFMAGAPVGTTAPPPSEVQPMAELRMSAPAGLGGMDRRLPPLPPLRTGSNKSASPDPPEDAAGQLLGGTALHRLQ